MIFDVTNGRDVTKAAPFPLMTGRAWLQVQHKPLSRVLLRD